MRERQPGAAADVALFRLDDGDFTFYDVDMRPYPGKQLLCNTLTIIAGRELPRGPEDPRAPWIELSDAQRALVDRGHTPSAWSGSAGHEPH